MKEVPPFLAPQRAWVATVFLVAAVHAFFCMSLWFAHYRRAKPRAVRGWLLRSHAIGLGLTIFVLGMIMLIVGFKPLQPGLASNTVCLHLILSALGGSYVAARDASKRAAFSGFLD